MEGQKSEIACVYLRNYRKEQFNLPIKGLHYSYNYEIRRITVHGC